jgi:hypothetical protein
LILIAKILIAIWRWEYLLQEDAEGVSVKKAMMIIQMRMMMKMSMKV